VGTSLAFIENIIYFNDYYYHFGVSLIYGRSLYSMPVHALCGGIMGYYIDKVKFTSNETKEIEYWISAFFFLVIVHGLYDFVLMNVYRN